QLFFADARPHQDALLRGPDLVPRPGDQETRRNDAIGRHRLQHVAGQLLRDELRVRFVVIEGAQNPITIAPGMVAQLVALEALTLAAGGDVEPVPTPTLAVVR